MQVRWQNVLMHRRRFMSRWVLWAAICTLVLRAGMPLLATAAAHLRDVPVGEVCDVYGVALPSATVGVPSAHVHHHHAGHTGHGSNPSSPHSDDRCALTGLGALAAPCAVVAVQASAHAGEMDVEPGICTSLHDACATWAARRKQGPPDLS